MESVHRQHDGDGCEQALLHLERSRTGFGTPHFQHRWSWVLTALILWGVLVGAVLAFLLGKRIRRVFREAAKTRRDIIALGQEIEDLGERGEIPMTPPDWSQKMHRPLPLPGDKVTIKGSLLL